VSAGLAPLAALPPVKARKIERQEKATEVSDEVTIIETPGQRSQRTTGPNHAALGSSSPISQ
jgi:hypothetical protein